MRYNIPMATDYSGKNSPQSYTVEQNRSSTKHAPSSLEEGLFNQKVEVTPDQSADTAVKLQQLNNLRNSLQQATLTHFREQLSKTLPTEQVNRILDHPNVERELNRLIQRVSLEAHPNLNSLSYKIAQGLTQVSEPHVRLAVNLSQAGDTNVKPEDVLQDIIKENAAVKHAYEPLSDSLTAGSPDSATSKLYQTIASPLVNGPDQVPTLKPEIDKIVALGAKDADTVTQQQIADALHQDLLGEILTHQVSSPTNTDQLVKDYLQKHGLDTNQIDPQSLGQFTTYVNEFREVISQDPQIATLQLVAETNHVSSQNLQELLHQANLSPAELVHDIKTTPPPEKSSTPATASPSTTPNLPQTPQEIDRAIRQADQYNYAADPSVQPASFSVRQVFSFFRRLIFKQHNQQGGFLVRIKRLFHFFSDNFTVSQQGVSFTPQFGNILKGFGSAQSGGGISSLLSGLGKLGKIFGFSGGGAGAAAGAASTGAAAAGTATATGAAVATSEVWVPILIIALVVGLILLVVFFGANTIVSTNISPVGGQGGGGSGGGGYCDPATNPDCTPLFCEGTCACPVSGPITQGPNGSYSHDGVNAIDIGLNHVNGAPIYSISTGTVSFAGWSPTGYGNLVIIDNPDNTQLYYAHLERFFVTIGQQVQAGEQIGTGDNTGFSTGPHLHLEYRGSGAQNILNLFNFTEAQKQILEGCNENCGGILCSN